MMNDLVKKPNINVAYTAEQIIDLQMSSEDPFYFIDNFIKVQHPTKGSIPLKLYGFQRKVIEAYHTHNKVIFLSARQLGKCLVSTTKIAYNKEYVNINKTVWKHLSIKNKLVTFFEKMLISLTTK